MKQLNLTQVHMLRFIMVSPFFHSFSIPFRVLLRLICLLTICGIGWIGFYSVGERLVVNNIQGYLQSRIVFYLMNVHHKKRTIWFARVSFISLYFFTFTPTDSLFPYFSTYGVNSQDNLRLNIPTKLIQI